MAQASVSDAPGTPPSGGVTGMSRHEETPRTHWSDYVAQLAWERLRIHEAPDKCVYSDCVCASVNI